MNFVNIAARFICWTGNHFGPRAGDRITFDGASLSGLCRKCGARVLQDSQGNWFKVADQAPEEPKC